MSFVQAVPFDTSKGGNVPDMCLDNVRKGYGIANKYGSAWEAWQHTQQHADRNLPDGLDIPLYYSYTATIDGVTENYGHINVRLANGTVWSDGNIYPNIDAYLTNRAPVFVGWGESVNDIMIIKEGEEPMFNQGDAVNISKAFFGEDNPPTFVSDQVGIDFKTAIYNISADQNVQQFLKANGGDGVNLANAVGGTPQDAKNLVNQPFKSIIYSYLLPRISKNGLTKQTVLDYVNKNLS